MDKDTSFHLSDADYSTEKECLPVREDKLPNSDTKFLVFWSSLVCLFRVCLSCNAPAVITRVRCQGVMITVHLLCHHNHVTKWCSTPISKGMSVGNLLISASILYSGNTFTSISEMMEICKVAFLGRTCYHKIQRNILFPVVHYIYDLHRNAILSSTIDTSPINLVGDGRCDSPVYNAKYGTYTLMDSSNNNILDFSVVHVGTVANSSRMELRSCRLSRLVARGRSKYKESNNRSAHTNTCPYGK